MSSFEYRSAVIRLRVIRAPTASWWWKVVPLPSWYPRVRGLPTSWNNAASRATGSRTARRRSVVRRTDVLDDGDRVRQHVLVAMDRVVLESHRRQLRQELVGETGVDQEPQSGRRVVDDHQLVELVADALGRHDLESCRHGRDGIDELGGRVELVPGDEPGRAQHAQRVVAEADLGPERGAQRRVAEVGRAVERVDERRRRIVGQLERHRVDGEVATGQIGVDVVGEHHVRLAGVVGVRLGPERRDLVHPLAAASVVRCAPIVPNRSPWVQIASAQPSRQRLDLVGTGVGGQVEVEVVTSVGDEEVADRSTDQVHPMAGRAKPRGERFEFAQHRRQPFGDHGRQVRTTAAPCDPHSAGASTFGAVTTTAAQHPVRARIGRWPYRSDVAHLVLLDHHMVPDEDDVERWLADARAGDARSMRTGALFPPSVPAFAAPAST